MVGPRPETTLVLGGARSGKSALAEGLLTVAPSPWVCIATATVYAGDNEMRARIDAHQARRGGDWRTIEAGHDLAGALLQAGDAPVLVDCLTLWLTTLILGEHDVALHTERLLAALPRPAATVLVSSEVGLGIVPDNALARRFRDESGTLQQRIAAVADRVLFVAAGLPLTLKEPR